MPIYTIKSALPVGDWPALISALFPAWAGEPATYGGDTATIEFSAKQPKVVTDSPALVVSGEFSGWEVSKFKLRRAIRAASLEAAFDSFVAALPAAARNEYNDAVTVRTDDANFAAAMSAFAGLAGMSEAQLAEILLAAQA